ncbi:2Fe-2S iron-sulfur cluster-binding protein [Marinomonas sp. RSW2]|uniref:2Fe-2S iron-sulfur cluster-binding protein n=1 Tax=Marinomonas maritima TaxID=2940935 RepID=A0ABT5WEH4_9GAMM|nr:2Fe-2S iron-sulfur cluster-binding protein [Marinomonas maritima]MDE8603092.1 2Fe-2S iron-sulfur cluster-binding protein [Marinomonas maritima]
MIEANDGDNLLTSLLLHHIDVLYGCRAGACGACRLYDQTNCESILSCQTHITSPMVLSTLLPSVFSTFSLMTKNVLDDANIELTLLGPSDESFGDHVAVSVSLEDDKTFVECMALNPAGTPLKVMLQENQFSAIEWQHVLALDLDDPLQVQLSSGARKGRLLHEMGVNDGSVVVITSPENAPFESYWRDALADYSAKYLGHFSLSSNPEPSMSLADEAFISFLRDAPANVGSGILQIIYHGQKISTKDWEQSLRPLRIRTNQLYFVR